MLPTLSPTATITAPNTPENGQILGDLPDEVGDISFASLLPANIDAIADPAISGNAAMPSGKGLPAAAAALGQETPIDGGEALAALAKVPVTPTEAAFDPVLATKHPKPWLSSGAEDIARLQDSGERFVAPVPPVTPHAVARPSIDGAPLNSVATPQVIPAERVDVSKLSAAIEAILPGKPAKPVAETLTENLPGKEVPAKTMSALVAPVRSLPSVESNAANLPRLSVKFIEKDAESRAPDPRPVAVATKPEQAEKPISAPQAPSVSTGHTQPSAPAPVLAQQTAPILSAVTSQTAPQPAEQARDFGALIDRLVQARDASAPANPASVRAVMSHTDFGAVTVRFDPSGTNLAAHVSSQDPAFAPAARAALAADAGPRSDDHQRGQQSGGAGQPGANSPDSQGNLQSGSQSRAGSHDRGEHPAGTASVREAEMPNEQQQSEDTQAAQRGLYI